MTQCTTIKVGEVSVKVIHDGKHAITTQDYEDAKKFADYVRSKCEHKNKEN